MRSVVKICLCILLSFHISSAAATIYPFDVKVSGHGAPIILIPGLASSGEVWGETVAALSDQYTCHVLTLAGFSTEDPLMELEDFLPQIQAGLTSYISNELKEKPILIGHSLGGFLSLSMAVAEQDLLEKIVIVDSYPFYSAAMYPGATVESSKPIADQMKSGMMKMDAAAFADQQSQTMRMMTIAQENQATAAQWSKDSDRATIAQAMFELMTTDLRGKLDHVEIPILVFGAWASGKNYGITKESVQSNFSQQFQGAKNCQISIAEEAFHFIMWDETEWFIKSLRIFLNEK